MRFRARVISRGYAEGEVIVSRKPVSFLGDVDPESGVIRDRESDIFGESVAGKIFVFPEGRGSTVGTYTLLRMKKAGCAPAGIVMVRSEAIVAVGAIIAGIPLVDMPEADVLEVIESGDHVRVFAEREGWVEVEKR
ncbi:aconitase X swivel domain-containing protein [Geoglobus ahangari]